MKLSTSRKLVPLIFLITIVLCAKFFIEAALTPIRIGASISQTGMYAEPSHMIELGYRLWEKEVNEKGGLLGRKVEIIVYNDNSDEKKAAALYRKLILEDKVDLILSPYGTPLTLAIADFTEKHKYPMLTCCSASEVIWQQKYHYMFGMYSVAPRYFIGLLDMMARKGYNEVALVYSDNSPYHFEIAEGVKTWGKRFGITLVYEKVFSSKNDLPLIVAELKTKKIKHLIISAYSPNGYALLREMKSQNYKPRILGMPILPIHPAFERNIGKEMANKVFAPSQWEPNERIPFPEAKQFIKDFEEYYKISPSYHAGSAYATCKILEEAVIRTRSLNRLEIRDYIAHLDTITVIGRFKVDRTGKQIGHNTIIIQWQNGKREIVWPAKMQTRPPVL